MATKSQKLSAELQALLDESPDAVLIVDRTGTIVALNRRAESLFGMAAERMRGRPVEGLIPRRLRKAHAAARAAYSAAPTLRAMSSRPRITGLRADGTEFEVEVSLMPVVGSSDGLVMAVVHDLAGRDRLEAVVTRTDQAMAALDAIPDAVVTTDADGNVDFLNRSAESLTGWARASARGRPLSEVLPLANESTGAPLASPVADCLHGRTPGGAYEAVLPTRSRRARRVLDLSTAPIRDGTGAITGAAVIARDVTHARLIARELSHRATHDALTGLVNRNEFERRLARVLANLGVEPGEHALCFLDLDGFKKVNDACGHLAGDELLRELSGVMRDRMRSRDTLARLGGDEFGVLLEHCRLPRAVRIAEGLRHAICAHRFTCGERTHVVGASIGIVPIGPGLGGPGDVLRAADAACYLAKRGGGNRVQLQAPERQAARPLRQHEWARRVLRAVEEDRFRIDAQPVVPLDHGGGHAPRLELLLRLADAGGEELSPSAFLPAARRHGLMPRIDGWVVRRAVQCLTEWQRTHPDAEPPTLAINLADESVMGGEVVDVVQDALAGTGVPPSSLCFEIGEPLAGAHPSVTADLLRELRALGCQTTLEHSGSGMAAFTLLRRLQLDYLKIAGYVTQGIDRDPVNRALATALNEVGHSLGLRTIAVQVEGPEVLECLRRVGVDFAQGFATGRPEPLDLAVERLDMPTAPDGVHQRE